MPQPELLQERNSNAISLTSLICRALIIAQWSQSSVRLSESTPVYGAMTLLSTETEFLLGSVRDTICRLCPADRGRSQHCTSALTHPVTCVGYWSVSRGGSCPPCVAPRRYTWRNGYYKFRDCSRTIKAQKCVYLKEPLQFDNPHISYLQRQPSPVRAGTSRWASVPSREQRWTEPDQHKPAAVGNSYAEKPKHGKGTAKTRHKNMSSRWTRSLNSLSRAQAHAGTTDSLELA